MKTSFKTTIALVVLIAGLSVSCKKTEPSTDSTTVVTDSVNTTIDTVAAPMQADTTIVDTSTQAKKTTTTTTTTTK